MTYNALPSAAVKHAIVFGDCWPVVSAVESIIDRVAPELTRNIATDLPSLIELLLIKPDAVLLLCLRPREHIFLFYALRQELIEHPVLIISDEMFFNDRLTLRLWGGLPWMMQDELSGMIIPPDQHEKFASEVDSESDNTLTRFLLSPSLPVGFSEVPMVFHLEERLMDYMSLLTYREMLSKGLTPFRMRLLQYIWSGRSSQDELSEAMGENQGKIWNEKHRLFIQLGISNRRLREILYGTQFCSFLQQTPFIAPAEVATIRSRVDANAISARENSDCPGKSQKEEGQKCAVNYQDKRLLPE
ncbi:TPA: hypothetical protein ACG1RN_000718 [Klebsiella oxytoca]